MLVLFDLIQPFENSWMRQDRLNVRRQGEIPVLLVHGYLCNRGSWWRLRRKLRKAGLVVATVNLEPPFADIDALGLILHPRIEEICTKTGAEKLALVGHSMGGLVCRAYLRRFGTGRVERLITLATPHQGTRTAWFGIGRDAREMQPGSAWLRQLAASAPVLPTLATWSTHDSLVVPQDSARLPGCHEFALPALGHVMMLFSPEVGRLLVSELRAGS